jgi:DNA/RNA endonuclease G (NUC1)
MHRFRSLVAPAAAAAAALAAAVAVARDAMQHAHSAGQLSPSATEHGMKVICKHGLPSHAFEDIIFREGHVLAWDRRNRIPLWVAQHLSASSLVAAKAAAQARKLKRHSNFTEDASIPEMFRSKLSDYKGSGYDRGHMIPAADAKLTDESCAACPSRSEKL